MTARACRHGSTILAMPERSRLSKHPSMAPYTRSIGSTSRSVLMSSRDEQPSLLLDAETLHQGSCEEYEGKAKASLRLHLAKAKRRSHNKHCGSAFCCLPQQRHHSTSSSSARTEQSSRSRDGSTGVRHQATYLNPSLPIVFAHGLFGFDEIQLAPEVLRQTLPKLSIVYWNGVAEVLTRRGIEVYTTRVPMSASIQERAHALRDAIDARYGDGQEINLIGHSMGGLDARYLVTHLKTRARIRSLTTIASPHRGSTFADLMLYRVIGRERLPWFLRKLEQIGIPGGGRAFECLTRDSMKTFNETTPDMADVKYLSWGAAFQPGWFNEFRLSHQAIYAEEGDNDGLVSIGSSKWGEYRGTLKASHLDLIGWTRKANSILASITRAEKPFDARAFYLTVCEDLALLGL